VGGGIVKPARPIPEGKRQMIRKLPKHAIGRAVAAHFAFSFEMISQEIFS
jgi:hypothetical protein